jgi:DNA-binding response OmpR family regulator
MRVLVIEDDRRMAALLEQGLREEGNHVTVCHNGNDGLSAALLPDFDVIVLDLMIPGIDGFEVTRRLRKAGKQTPVLMLTARDTPTDMIRGLDLGADDYITKPFGLNVLLARVRAVARRGPATQPVVLTAGPLELNTASREVRLAGRKIPLTRTEYAIIEVLVRNHGRVVPRETILRHVWGHTESVESNTLDAFIKLVRAKVDTLPDRRMVHTVRGVGYVLRLEE